MMFVDDDNINNANDSFKKNQHYNKNFTNSPSLKNDSVIIYIF